MGRFVLGPVVLAIYALWWVDSMLLARAALQWFLLSWVVGISLFSMLIFEP